MSNIQRIILSGGGTGGHIYPALSIYRTMKEQNPNLECLYVGTDNGLEGSLVPEMGLDFQALPMQGFKRSLSLENVKTLYYMMTSTQKAKKLIQNFQPDVIIGTGGYVCAPVLLAGSRLGIPTLIHEQNSVAGLTNKFLSRHVDRIATCFQPVHADFAKYADKIRFTGNPRAQEMANIQPQPTILSQQFGLKDDQPTVLIFGGSRGAPAINKSAFGAIEHWSQADYQVIIATGQVHYEEFRDNLDSQHSGGYDNIKVVAYIKNMPQVFQAIDLVICRSGATTLTELMALGKPSILIPSPYVTANHQEFNARALSDQYAAVMIKESDLNSNLLIEEVDQLMADPGKLHRMSQNASEMAVTDATDRIIKALEDIV